MAHWNWWIRGTNKNRTEKIEKVIATETHSQLENYFIFLHFSIDKSVNYGIMLTVTKRNAQ